MDKFGNITKAICLVLGGLALLGLAVILAPVLAGIAGLLLGVVEVLLPILIVVLVVYIVYRVLEARRSGRPY